MILDLDLYKYIKINNKDLYIGKKINNGSCGFINECIYNNTNYIVKIIKKENGITNLLEPFIMTSIIHENLNNSIDILEDLDTLYIIQEKAITDLSIWRDNNCKFNENYYLHIVSSIINGLCLLHSNNIIHGDIKLNNIFLYNNDIVKLADYSYSVVDNKDIDKRQYNICTTTHRPLEAWDNTKWGKDVDIWSLGCTIFELIYGYCLFPIQDYIDKDNKKRLIKKYKNSLYDWFILELNEGKYKKFNVEYSKPLIPFNISKKKDKIYKILLECLKCDRMNIFDIKNKYFSQVDNIYSIEYYSIKNNIYKNIFLYNIINLDKNNLSLNKDLNNELNLDKYIYYISKQILDIIKFDKEKEKNYTIASIIISYILMNKKIFDLGKYKEYNNDINLCYLDICNQINYSFEKLFSEH